MKFTEAIKIALQSLWANKLRSILTLMGVMIGVAAVIMVITLVNGANQFVATKVYGYGADVFTASKQPWVVIPPDVPSVPEYYDRESYWPPESLARRLAILPRIEAYQTSLRDGQR